MLIEHESPEAFKDNFKELQRQGKPYRECLKASLELYSKAIKHKVDHNRARFKRKAR